MLKELVLSVALAIPTYSVLINYLDKDKREKQRIKNNLQYIFTENNIKNSMENTPKIIEVELLEYGFIVSVNIKKVCSYAEVEKLKDYINTVFSSAETIINNKKSYVEIRVISKPINEIQYKYIPLNQYQLLMGFNSLGEPLVADMRETPHVLVSGLSSSGKTSMVKVIIRNLRNVDVVMINGFLEDYNEISTIRNVLGEKESIRYLLRLKANLYKRRKPLYLVLEEMQMFNSNKFLTELIKELLAICRHYNIFIIGIVQISTKENCRFKDLFNVRCSFKQIDTSSYTVCLGCSVEKQLKKREFYLFSNGLYRGKTYTI